MSYVVSVGGDPINPNPFTYSQISMTGNIDMAWPFNNQSSTYVATNWVDITSSAAYTATMPDAREAPEGQEAVFNNYGSFTITVNDAGGSSITTVASGECKRVWVTDNSTEAGTWRVSNIGSGTTSADASALAGYGLIAQAGQLSQSMPVSSYSTDFTITSGLRAYLVLWTGGSGTATLDSAATLGANWFCDVKNGGNGTLNINGNGADIDGSSDIDISPNQGFTITTDGIEFYTTGRLIPDTSGLTLLNKSLGTGSTTVLTAAESAYNIINFTGSLSTDATVEVPAAVNQWTMINSTSGTMYSTTVIATGGTGVTITQGSQRILYCDGTDVDYSDQLGSGTVTSVGSGTGLTGGPITTSGSLSIANTAVTAGSYGASGTIATFTVNQQGQLTAASNTAIAVSASNISGIVPTTKGGTSLSSPGTSGNFLQSDGTDWTSATVLGSANGGTGLSSSGTSGNVLTSNGTTWQSTAVVTSNRFTNSLSSDVALNNTSNFFDGPTVSQGSTGIWFAAGTVTVQDTAGGANFQAKLWDGTTVIASANITPDAVNLVSTISLSGYLSSPAGNLRISVRDVTSTSGKILSSQTGLGKDSTITAFRIA